MACLLMAPGKSSAGLMRRAPFRYSLQMVDNPVRTIPSGLNLAVRSAAGTHIVRVDAHSRLPGDYLRTIVAALDGGVGDVVGPQVLHVAASDAVVARTIAAMLNSRFGNGGTPSRNRLHVPTRTTHAVMSCYRREVWVSVGGYDEALLSNEDFEFDYRANLAGFKVVSLPHPVFSLIARALHVGRICEAALALWAMEGKSIDNASGFNQAAPTHPDIHIAFHGCGLRDCLAARVVPGLCLLPGRRPVGGDGRIDPTEQLCPQAAFRGTGAASRCDNAFRMGGRSVVRSFVTPWPQALNTRSFETSRHRPIMISSRTAKTALRRLKSVFDRNFYAYPKNVRCNVCGWEGRRFLGATGTNRSTAQL